MAASTAGRASARPCVPSSTPSGGHGRCATTRAPTCSTARCATSWASAPGRLARSSRPDYLRFDFPLERGLTSDELRAIETEVRRIIRDARTVTPSVMTMEEAVAAGADAFFDEKYGERVRTVRVDGYSHELCGGTHCRKTGQIGGFVITGERSIGSGSAGSKPSPATARTPGRPLDRPLDKAAGDRRPVGRSPTGADRSSPGRAARNEAPPEGGRWLGASRVRRTRGAGGRSRARRGSHHVRRTVPVDRRGQGRRQGPPRGRCVRASSPSPSTATSRSYSSRSATTSSDAASRRQARPGCGDRDRRQGRRPSGHGPGQGHADGKGVQAALAAVRQALEASG